MSAPSVIPPVARTVFATVAVVAVAAVVLSGTTPPPTDDWPWWLATLAVPLLTRWKVFITRGASSIVLGFEFVVVIFFAFAVPQHAAFLAAVGWLLTALVPRWQAGNGTSDAPWIRLYNIAITVLASVATVEVVTHMPHGEGSGPLPLLAVVLGAGAYFAVDYLLTMIAMPLLGRGSLREASWYDDLGVTLACQCCVATMGYLAAMTYHADPWALPTMLVPLSTCVVASRGFVRSQRERVRATALFVLATRLHGASGAPDVLAMAPEGTCDALRAEHASLEDVDPGDEVTRVLVPADPPRWLAVAPRRSAQVFDADDLQTLNLIASMTADHLRRLQLRDQLEHLAAHDPLTGLLNRSSLTALLDSHLAAARSVSLLFCDLDGFKAVNDRLGHEAGDRLLQVVADRLSSCVGQHDLVARWGGDEFVVLLEGASLSEAELVGRLLLHAVAQPVLLQGEVAHVGISVGIATSKPGLDGTDLLLGRADQAMYRAKAAGRGGLMVARPVA